MARVSRRRLRAVPDAPPSADDEPPRPTVPEGDFFRSNSALVYADEKPMGPVQLRTMLCLPERFETLGLPVWRAHEEAIIRFLAMRGRGRDCSWTALRGGQERVAKSLAHELCIGYGNITRAIGHLKRMQLVRVVLTEKERQTISFTNVVHALAAEAQWRYLLYDTDPARVMTLSKASGWQIMLEALDRWFQRNRSKRPSSWEDRRAGILGFELATSL